jgi:hypothetical protein
MTVLSLPAVIWRSRQLVITPEQLGLRNVVECQQRAVRLGLTPMPLLPYRQEYWRLDKLLVWSRGNGFDQLPMLGHGNAHR